uniref:UNC80 domain-containing protein n=1 Tax=Schistosoma mansoni TaxID=6183 RepID=A0A3Q0KT99_SCHMA
MNKSSSSHIPLPIQSFLFSQTCSFLQKPSARDGVCTTFEKVLVQNILHGRSIVLCEAIHSISRWKFVKAALPHVLHCGAIMLREKLRDKSAADLPHQKHTLNSCGLSHDRTRLNFSQTETKLLYTLHWILLDAASECEDAELEASNHPASIPKHSTDRYVHDLASLQLFIYLYAPIIEQLKPTDFDTLKLEAGLRLWIPLMEYCQPNRGTLSSPVKFFTHDSNILSRPVVLNIDGIESPKTSSILNDYIERKSVSLETSEEIPTNVHTVNISDKGSEINNKLPSAVNSFELLVDSASIPHVEANSDESVSSAINIPDNYQPSLTHAHNATGHILRIQPPKATPEYLDDEEEFSEETNSEAAATGTMATTVVVPEMSPPKQEQEHVAPGFERIQKFLNSFMDPYKQLSEKLKYSVADSEFIQPSVGTYCMFATHCDLAVIRCLYCPEWSESGIYWSLCYLFNRLLQIRSEWIKIKPNNRKLLRLRRGNLPSEHLFKWIPGLWSAASSHQARINHITGEMVKEIRSLSLPNISSRCVSSICQRNPSEQCNREFGKDSKNNDLNQHKHTEQQEELCEAQSKSTSNIIQSFPGNSNTPSSIKHSTISSNLDVSLNRKGISCIVGSSASLLNIDKSESNFMKLECSKDRAQQQWQPQQLNTTPVLTDIGLSDSSFTLPLPIVSFGGQQHQNQQQQPAWRSSKRSRITDIKERFTRASKFKSGDSNMKFQPLSSIEAPGMTGINTLIECDQPSVMTGEKQVFYPQTKRSVQTGGENRRLPPNEKPSQGFDTTSNDSEANKRDPPVSSNASSLHIGLKLGLSPCTPSIAVANKPVDNTDTVSNDEQLFAKTLPRSLTDSDIIYHSSEKVDEVPGAAYYITPNGHLDYSVILRSLYWCSTVHTSSRVCFNLVSCLSVLFDLGIFDMKPGACSLKNVSFEKPGHLRRFRKNNHYERNKCSKSFKTPILNKLVARESHTNSNFNNRGGYDSSNLHSGSKVRLHDSTVGFSSSNLSSSRVSVGICSESHESENGDDGDGDLVSKRQFSSRADNESLISEDGITSSVCAKDFSPLGSPQSSIDLEKDPCSTPRIKSSGNIQPRLRNNEKFMSKSAYRPKSRVQQKQVVSCDISNHLIRTHFTLAAEMLIRIIRSVGCRHGHSNSPNFMNHHYHHQQEEQENSVDPNNHFRSLTHDCLIYLHQLNPNLFKRLIIRIVSSSTVADLVEILHSFTGFCLDPVTRCYEHSDQNRKSYLNYGNSFGENDTGQDTRGAEGLIVSYLFGPFVRRLVRCRRELSSQENVSLFSDIRQLFTYIREIHGSTFRKNMLVALLCPVQKICEVTTPKPSTPLPRMSARNSMWLVPRHDKRRSTFNVFIDPLTETESYSSGHRESSWYNLLSRPSTAGRNVRIHSNGSSSTIAASFENEYPSRSKSECPTTDQSTGQMIIEHRWINLSALKEGLFDFAFLLDCCEPGLIPEPQLIAALFDLDAPVLARACLLLECAFLVHRCNRGEWAGWMKFNLPSSFRSSAGFISSNTTNSNNNPSQANENTNNNNHPVDISEIKRVAGYLFYAWGEALGHRLQYFTSLMSSSNSSIITNLDPSGDKVYGSDKSKDVNYRSNVEMEQNFLDDASVNPTGESCPYALLTVGVQLLFEITTYLRETHQRLPQSNPNYDGKCGQSAQHSSRNSVIKRSLTREASGDKKTDTFKHTYSSGSSGASFKGAKRRLSILMPIFGSAGNNSPEDGITNEIEKHSSSSVKPVITTSTDKSISGRRGTSSRRISFAVMDDSKDISDSTNASANYLDQSLEANESQHRLSVSKGLLQKHRGSGSFRYFSAHGSDLSNVFEQHPSLIEQINRTSSGDICTDVFDDSTDNPGTPVSEDDNQDVYHEERNLLQMNHVNKSLIHSNPLRLKSRQGHHSRYDETIKSHTSVRRSVSAALSAKKSLKSNTLHHALAFGDNETYHVHDYTSHMPWVDAVIEFANYTSFNCDHQNSCASNCFEYQQHQCRNLLNAMKQVYESETESKFVVSVDRQYLYSLSTVSTTSTSTTTSATLNRGLNVTCDTGTTLPVSSNVIRQHRPNNSRSENSSDQDSSHLDSTEDLSDSDVIHQQQVNPAYIKNKINTLKSLSNIIQSKDSLTGLGKSTDNDLDVHNFLLMHQGALTASSGSDFWKARSKLFIKSAKRKESNIFGPSSSRENMNLLTKIRMKSFNRSINPSSFENDTPGLTGLINLSMLAGAGAGLLKSSRQSISLNPPLLGIEADEASETSPGFEDDDGFKSQIRKPVRFRKHHSGELPIQCYLDTHIKNLCSSGFNLLNKAALLLTNNQLAKMLPLAWELLLETDTEMSSSAACFILFCGVRCPQIVQEMILDEMRHEKPTQRFNAILRFRTLWCHRFHVWSRLEENAPSQLRVPPSFIEFVLPSPTLGYPGFEAPDPVWQIRKGTSAEEVQLKQNEATKTFVTASTSRRKQQQELLARAIATETMRRREARQSFHLTTCPVLERATIEPAFSKEHRDEGNIDDSIANSSGFNSGVGGGQIGVSNSTQDEYTAAVRRLSLAPINRTVLNQARNLSWRQSSIPWLRNSVIAHDDEDRWLSGFHSLFPSQPLQQAQLVFPSALCSASVLLINLLDDTAINEHGTAVNTIAEYVIFNCLLEDTPLFLRFIFERLTRIKNKDELIFILRKMIQRLPELPMQTAHALFNNLVGYIMFHIRTPSFNAPQSIASALSVLHLVIPYVQNIYFKDLKQTMRREQIDSTLLLTANLPCAKQFNVFDNSIGVAQLVRLQDENKDYQFEDILKDVLSASDILEDERCSYYLCDERSNIIRNSSHYIRDFYSFKRNHTPKLRLRQYDKKHGMYLLQQNALSLKFQEIGKVSFTLSVLRCTPTAQIPNHVFFLHEELTKLPSFPRKALESDFNLYDWPTYGRPLFALDTIHKLSWCHLISSLFMMMPKTYPWSSDLQIFLNVYNGTLILHAEDSSVLRQCLAFFIQCCYQFKTVFATTGYSGIVPTLVRVYNQNTHNPVLTQAIEFTFRQFYVMHRTPFILQLLGCIANYVTTNNEIIGVGDEFYRIQPGAVYRLLRVISRPLDDNLRILELCNIQKPLEALDFCYDDEEANWSILEVINLCVAVIVYAPDSYRSRQMLIILQALMPLILKDLSYICAEEGNGTDPKKAELSAIQKISIAMRQLISTAEFMSRRIEDIRQLNYLAPGGPTECRKETPGLLLTGVATRLVNYEAAKSNFKSLDKTKYNETAVKITRNELCNEINTLPVNKGFPLSVSSNVSRERDIQSNQMLRNPAAATSGHHRPTAYEPREAVLQLACEFLSTCSGRLLEMEEKQRISDLLDAKSHMRLADITQFMLKQVSNSPDFLVSSALQRYFLEVLPVIDWSHESLRSCKAVECLLGRLNRTLPKMLEFAIRSKATHHWNEFVKLIRSVYYILKRNRSVAHMKEIRVLAEILKKAIVFDVSRCLSSFPKSRLDIQPNHATSRYGRPSFGEVLFGITSQESSSISASVGVPKQSNKMKHIPLNGDAGSYCSPRHSNQEAWPETDLDDSDKYPCQFTTEVIRLLSLFLQILGPHCSLKDLCERISPEYNIRFPTLREGGFQTLVIYLNNLILPMLFRGCAGRKDSPTLSRDNVFYALDVCITALFATDYASNADGQRSIYHLTTISNSTPQQQQTCESSQSGPLSGKLKDKSNKSQTTGFELRTNPSISLNRQATGSIAQDNTSTITTSNNNSASIKLINLSNLSTDFEGGSYASLIRLLSPSLVKILPDESGPLNTSVQITVSNKCQGKQDSFQLKSRPSVIPNLNKTSILTQKSRPQVYYSKLLDPTSINLGFPIDKIKSFKAEFAHRLGFLGLKLILAAYTRHAAVRMKLLVAALTQLALNGQSGIQLWKFFDFLVTYRPPLFVHLLPFIRFKMALLQCASQGEQAYQQIVNQKLIGLHLPIPQTVASILRSLSNELQIINSDIKAFSKRSYNEITLPRTSSLHDSLRRLRSSDNTSSVSARSNKHAKLTKVVSKNTDEYTHKSSHKVSSKDQVNQKPQSYVLASVTSNSTCSVDYRDENTIGISNLDRHLLGRKSFNQEFRQTTGVRDPRKRIHAHEGSCLLVRTRDYGQTDPILTASAESLVRKSQKPGHKRNRTQETKLTGNAQMYKNLRIDTLKARLSNDSSADNQSENSLVSEGLIAPLGPAAAAAIASSLYGSGAPYLHAQVRARQELASLVRIPAPKLNSREKLSEIDFAFVPEVSGDDNDKKSPIQQKSKYQSNQTKVEHKVTGNFMLKLENLEEKSPDEKDQLRDITKSPITTSVVVGTANISTTKTATEAEAPRAVQVTGDKISPMISRKSKINYV